MDSLEAEPEMGVGMHMDVLSGRKGLREAEQGEGKSSVRMWGQRDLTRCRMTVGKEMAVVSLGQLVIGPGCQEG